MKANAATLGPRDSYRVEKATRELLPKILPPSWQPVDKRENGCFYVTRGGLGVIAEVELVDDALWLHVSTSRRDRIPSWEDLREVKDTIIGRDRKAIQVLPREAEYVNLHPYVLHLYAPIDRDPLPDFRMVDDDGRVGI